MAKNMTTVELDFVDDLNGSMKIASENEQLIGKLNVGETEKLTDKDYALILMTKQGADGRFPLKTKDQALLSCFYLEKNAGKMPASMVKVASSFLKKACVSHSAPVSRFIEARSSDDIQSNSVSPYMEEQSKYACEGKYPINTPEEVKQAVAYFDEHHKQFPPEKAVVFCENLIKSAEDNGVKINRDSRVNDYDARTYSDVIKLAVDRRVKLLDGIYEYGDSDGDAVKLAYKRLYGQKDKVKPIEFSKKLAHIDRLCGIDSHWDRGSIDNPFVATFRSSGNRLIKIADKTILPGQLRQIAESDKLAKVFSSDFVDEFKTSPEEIFESLPMPDKKLIASLIEG